MMLSQRTLMRTLATLAVLASAVSGVRASAATVEQPRVTLLSRIQSYLTTRTGVTMVEVYDATTHQRFAYHIGLVMYAASTVKVDILATRLYQTHGKLSARDQDLAAVMIEQSDNDAASVLWNEDGRGAGIAAFNRLNGGMTATVMGHHWGLTRTTAHDQAELVRSLVYGSRTLNAAERAYMLDLMAHISAPDYWGVNSGVRDGVTVQMKNGWLALQQPNADWQINSVGHVHGDGRDYVLAIMSAGNPSCTYGVVTTNTVAAITYSSLRPIVT